MFGGSRQRQIEEVIEQGRLLASYKMSTDPLIAFGILEAEALATAAFPIGRLETVLVPTEPWLVNKRTHNALLQKSQGAPKAIAEAPDPAAARSVARQYLAAYAKVVHPLQYSGGDDAMLAEKFLTRCREYIALLS